MSLRADAIPRLATGPSVIRGLVTGLDDAGWRWRPAPDAWSILEIVHHMRDEEEFDFPFRLRLTLEDPSQAWPSIDPPGWVTERTYNQANPKRVVAEFAELRAGNLDWLRELADPDWKRAYEHPKLGTMPAQRLLRAWCAHDILHQRQILQRQWQRLTAAAEPGELDYAGNW